MKNASIGRNTAVKPKAGKATGIMAELMREEFLPANCATLDYIEGISEGIYLFVEETPRLIVGERFVLRNRNGNLGCLYRPKFPWGLVRRAELVEITKREGGVFHVLEKPADGCKTGLLFVDTRIPDNFYNKNQINAWFGLSGTGEVFVSSNGCHLVEFDEGEHLSVFYPDGFVRLVTFNDSVFDLKPLSPADMAKMRVEKAKSQLEACDDSEVGIRRRFGILFGLASLLMLTKHEKEARTVILDFFRELKDLPRNVQASIRDNLERLGDSQALAFADNISFFNGAVLAKRSGPPAEAKAKKAEKAGRDREFTLATKGPSGSKSKATSNPDSKKGRRRLRKADRKRVAGK